MFLKLSALVVTITVLATGAGGCYQVSEAGGQTTIRFGPLVRLLLVLVPLLLLAFGAVLAAFPRRRQTGVLLIAGVTFLGVLIVPGILKDTVVITPRRITQTTGFWFSPSSKGFDYSDIDHVEIIRRTEQRRRSRSTVTIWLLHKRGGVTQELDPGDLWDAADGVIISKLQSHGVRFGRPRR